MKYLRLNCIVGLFICTGLLAACKPRQEQSSRVKDLNAGQAMSDNDDSLNQMKKDRKVVVIFYANDTAAPRKTDPAYENLEVLTRLLEDAASREEDTAVKNQLSGLAGRLNHDWDHFNTVVRNNLDDLATKLCTTVGSKYADSVGGLAVFRNNAAFNARQDSTSSPTARYLQNLSWYSCKPGDESFQQHTISVPQFNEFPYDSQPFSNSASFETALKSVKTVFDAKTSRFILITKSHGSPNNALVPHLSVDLRERIRKDPAKVLDAITKGAKETTGLDSWKADTILDGVDGILKSNFDSTLEKGISKIEYLRILNSLGQVSSKTDSPMVFPIVLMESCKSDLKFSKDVEIQQVLRTYGTGYKGFSMSNVGLLYTSDEKGLRYEDVKYKDLLSFMSNNATDFQDLFKQILDTTSHKGRSN